MENRSAIRRLNALLKRALLCAGILGLSAGATTVRAQTSAAPPMEVFTKDGAEGCLLPPSGQWNGKLLIVAHGFVPEDRPLKSAAAFLNPDDPVYRRLHDAGWLVGATSYRRNGLILRDGAADVEAVRAHAAAKYGPPQCVVVEGTSMGGFIAARLAEAPPDAGYKGVLGLGAALQIDAPTEPDTKLAATPKIPALFLSTRDEIAGPTDYAQRAAQRGKDAPGVVAPAVWSVARDGHVNLSRREVGAALDALLQWIDGGKIEPRKDATLPPPPHPQTAAFAPDGDLAMGKVVAVDPVYGNLTVDFRPEDMAKLGLKKGDFAAIRIGDAAAAKEERILCGSTFGDVKTGEWVCFPTADDYLFVCRNFADAAGSVGAKLGSPVMLRAPKGKP